ncbi:MAG: diguanylate cyclase [Clostridia bacterium]|nr:diguanylate cyclase [Clostridia bacterium]MDK2901796.1 diguanylate cyclase [Thermosediminibacterales bacterium]
MPFTIIQIVISTICGILIKKLHQQVHTDTLTGLRNRKYFYTKLSELKTKSPVSLMLIDVDNFKGINDTYGHIAGDQVL